MHPEIAEHILIHCDRTRSKEARFALERLLWEPLRSHQMQLASDCVLSPENDILRAQETQKHLMHDGLWQCSLCRKIFRTEHYLDKHLARKHSELRNSTGTSCLSDLCGVLVPCVPLTPRALPPVSTILLLRQDSGQPIAEGAKAKPYCNNRRLRRNRVHACEEVIRHCLHDHVSFHSGFSSHGKLDDFREDLCERAIDIECVARDDVWSRFGPPDRALRPGKKRSLPWNLGWTILLLLVMFVVIWRRSNQNRSAGHQRRRRKAR